jgi:uncharacterized repeat protein (TIGR03806 family)
MSPIKPHYFAWLAGALGLSLLVSCGGSDNAVEATPPPVVPTPPTALEVKIFDQSTAPDKLSDWHLVLSDGKQLSLNKGVLPYDLNSALFSDYAFKLRAMYIPAGKQITYKTDGSIEFPIGSAIAKTFYYPKATGTDAAYSAVARQNQTAQGDSIDLANNLLIETRILVLQPNGTWSGLPYLWDTDQKDAKLKIGGADVKLELVGSTGANEKFVYGVPNAQSCQQCHSTQSAGGQGILPIGPKPRNLNKNYAYSATLSKNQLVYWDELKLLSGFTGIASAPVNADWRDVTQTIEARAKAYLDVNCAHCHSSRGAAFQTGLMLDIATVGTSSPSTSQWGVCKKPLAYGGPGGAYKYGIEPGQADVSLLAYRMSHTSTGDVMPVIGRHVNHTEGNTVVRDWINQLSLPACH